MLRNERLVSPTSGVMSIIWLLSKNTRFRPVSPANGPISPIRLSIKRRSVRPVNPLSGLMSLIVLLFRSRDIRPVRFSSPVRSMMKRPRSPLASSVSIVSTCDLKIGSVSPPERPRASRMMASRKGSGKVTVGSSGAVMVNCTKTN